MINILLVCTAGMSTSMLVKKMETASVEMGVEINVWAVGDAAFKDNAPKADIVLLGPQVRFLLKNLEAQLKGEKPIMVIDMMAYGAMNGKKVLEDALATLNK